MVVMVVVVVHVTEMVNIKQHVVVVMMPMMVNIDEHMLVAVVEVVMCVVVCMV